MSDFTGFLMSPQLSSAPRGGPLLPTKKSRRPVAEIVHNHPQALENFFQELSGFLHIGPLFTLIAWCNTPSAIAASGMSLQLEKQTGSGSSSLGTCC